MQKRNIIVIGASAGGFEAIRQLVHDLPSDLDAAIFIVRHIAPDINGVFAEVLNKQQTLYAAHAIDKEPIKMNRIYLAPPDRHLIIEEGRVRVTHGPKENRFRPAVDPLFRSAAYVYNQRVIGIILSGALDDGSAGLWTIKNRGGIAIVQDPADAEVPSMPESALRAVAVDHQAPVSKMAPLLVQLSAEQVIENNKVAMKENEKTRTEVNTVLQQGDFKNKLMQFGELTPYTCPECNGVLLALKEGGRTRFRCYIGHAFSPDSLLSAVTDSIEDGLWNTVRALEENVFLLNHIGDHFAEANEPHTAAMYFKKAKEAENQAQTVRKTLLEHEQLSSEKIKEQVEEAS